MHTRALGQGLEVSAVGLGAMGMSMSYGPNPGDRDDMIGVLRHAEGLAEALAALAALEHGDAVVGPAAWETTNLLTISTALTEAAALRTETRGSHWREDFPETSDLTTSRYTVIRQRAGALHVATEPVRFEIVAPGQTILHEEAL